MMQRRAVGMEPDHGAVAEAVGRLAQDPAGPGRPLRLQTERSLPAVRQVDIGNDAGRIGRKLRWKGAGTRRRESSGQ